MKEVHAKLPAYAAPAAGARRYVELSWSHNPTGELTSGAECFWRAAKTLLHEELKEPNQAVRGVYPIVFLYRHSLELYLKGILRDLSRLAKLQNQVAPFPVQLLSTHKLEPLLRPLKPLFVGSWHWHLRSSTLLDFDTLLALIRELDQVDPQSYGFRYPVDKTLSRPSISLPLRIDLAALADRIEHVLGVLRIVASGLDFEIDIVYLTNLEPA